MIRRQLLIANHKAFTYISVTLPIIAEITSAMATLSCFMFNANFGPYNLFESSPHIDLMKCFTNTDLYIALETSLTDHKHC